MMPYFPDWVIILTQTKLLLVRGVAGEEAREHEAGAGHGGEAGATWQDRHVHITSGHVNYTSG